jgi:hypothetical protein
MVNGECLTENGPTVVHDLLPQAFIETGIGTVTTIHHLPFTIYHLLLSA